MKIVGLMLVRNSAWILGLTLRAALEWCDEVIVLDHASMDETPDLVHDLAKGGCILYERTDEADFNEMDMRRILLERARMRGATHFATIDDDEALTANFLVRIREFASDLAPGFSFAVPMVACWRSLDVYRTDAASCWSRTGMHILFADHPSIMWRPRPNGYQLHSRQPFGIRGTFQPYAKPSQGGCFHMQWANWPRCMTKHTWYVLRDAEHSRRSGIPDNPELINARYVQTLDERTLSTTPIPAEWWSPYREWRDRYVDLGRPGWHAAECERLAEALGPSGLKGLNLFGWKPNKEPA